MRVSVVGSYPKAAGLKMTGLGGLEETGDGGEGRGLKGGSWNLVLVVGGRIGDMWIWGIPRVTSGAAGGTGGGGRVGLAGRVRGETGVGGACVVSVRIRST